MKDEEKLAKSEVQYENPATGMDHCKECRYFHDRKCEIVAGPINPNGWCTLYSYRRDPNAR